MRTTILTLCMLVGSGLTQASSSTYTQPLPGHEFTIHQVELKAGNFKPGDGGLNAYWYLDSIPTHSFKVTVDASYNSQFYNDFPNSDFVIKNDHFATHESSFGDEHYHYYGFRNGILYKLGHVDYNSKTGEKEVKYFLNFEVKMKDVFFYGYTFTDRWEASYKENGTGANVYWSDAITKCDIDGQGTLDVDGKRIQDVYRIKRSRTFTERSPNRPNVIHEYVYYEYWKENIPFPIVTLEHRKTNGGSDRYYAYYLNQNHFLPTGNEELTESMSEFNVFPNPAKDLINIEFSSSKESPERITLTDYQGRTVKEWSGSIVGNSNSRLELSLNVPSGMYLLNVQFENRSQVKRISVI